MVTLKKEATGYMVIVDNHMIGYLDSKGFYVQSIVVGSEALFEIALKAQEVEKFGDKIPICVQCSGTPNFPRAIRNYRGGPKCIKCKHEIHGQFKIFRPAW